MAELDIRLTLRAKASKVLRQEAQKLDMNATSYAKLLIMQAIKPAMEVEQNQEAN